MQGNLKSLRILFISICVLYALRMVRFVLKITTAMRTEDILDPYILVAKTLMIFGLLLSIYLRIESTNGNLHTEVEIIRTSFDCIHLLSTDGFEGGSLIRSND
jgi:hypothetical protein